MKQYLNLSAFAAIAAMLMLTISCSNDEVLSEKLSNPEPVNFSVGVGGNSNMSVTRAQAASASTYRTTINERFASGDAIGIYTTDADGKYYTKVFTTSASSESDNAATNLNTASLSPIQKFYWSTTSDKKKFHAWSQGNSTNLLGATAAGSGTTTAKPTFEKFTIDVDQSAVITNKEFLYSYGCIAYSTEAKCIVLNHQLMRIDLELVTEKAAASMLADKTVTIGEATSGKGTTIAGTFNVPDNSLSSEDLGSGHNGTWTLSVESSDVDKAVIPYVLTAETQVPDNDAVEADRGKYRTKYSVILHPQSFNEKSMFVITYDGATYKYTGVSTDDLSGGVGKKYTYKIVITPAGLNVNQASISSWNTTETDKGTVTANLQ